jgi:hypothetical protein
MKRWFLLLLAVTLASGRPVSGGPPLSAECRLVQAAYLALKANPASAQAQRVYLQAFPKSRDKFLRIFMGEPPHGFPSDGHEYLEALQQLGATYPAKVLSICFGIEQKMSRTSDAVAYLADATVKLGIAHPQIFANETKRLTVADQVALCRFLADEEGIKWDDQYVQLMQQLRQTGAAGVSAKLQQAKVWRMKLPNH